MKKTIVTLAVCLFTTFSLSAQNDHGKKMHENMAMFTDAKLGTAYEHYLHIKDALVASKIEDAKKGAGQLEQALKAVGGSTKAQEVSAKLVNAATLDEQRKLFSILSNEMATLVKGGKLSMGMLYLEYCPMANNNAGAYWLSNDKEIKNPYFGDKMLKCGSVKELIQ